MDRQSSRTEYEIQQMFRLHEEATAAFRAELAKRSPEKVEYDNYLLAQMRKGKPFKIAFRKANAKFPAQALTPQLEDFSHVEDHYDYFLFMEKTDYHRREIEKCNERIRETDEKINTL